MKVHHLNCATLCPVGGRLVNGDAAVCERARLVCHCLLVETSDGLALIDTGLGESDVLGRRGALYQRRLRVFMGARLEREETAVQQIARLGFSPDEVRHIVLTHLDLDHAGGLDDFPRAEVHVLASEHDAAMNRRSWNERQRYRAETWAHRPRWVLHHPDAGERWFGFDAVRRISGLPPELLIFPLHGHTRGHAGVAVDTPEGWLVHAGDAYFFHGEMNAERPWCTPGLDLFQRLLAHDDGARRRNQERLRELIADPSSRARVFCAHDPTELERYAPR